MLQLMLDPKMPKFQNLGSFHGHPDFEINYSSCKVNNFLRGYIQDEVLMEQTIMLKSIVKKFRNMEVDELDCSVFVTFGYKRKMDCSI